ncbi:thialysine N-epsilon-acetyltransferase-like [Tubulanus polymorphus]|uniref:thialysine N-epsilon-acetyltransferase-like n=1 Tax=Tubulanus polymorphus TaxID=672921 RepID=UPI003DA270B4
MNYAIRKAVKEDCKQIFKLMQDLVDFEKVWDDFTLNYEEFERGGFGEDPMFRCLVAEVCQPDSGDEKDGIVGYCLYYPIFSTFEGRSIYLENIYVSPEHRGSKLATTLIRQLSKIALKEFCCKIRFAVLHDNKLAYDLYRYLEAEDINERQNWRSMAWHNETLQKMSAIEAPKNIKIDL